MDLRAQYLLYTPEVKTLDEIQLLEKLELLKQDLDLIERSEKVLHDRWERVRVEIIETTRALCEIIKSRSRSR